jgi:hypothetical protein
MYLPRKPDVSSATVPDATSGGAIGWGLVYGCGEPLWHASAEPGSLGSDKQCDRFCGDAFFAAEVA